MARSVLDRRDAVPLTILEPTIYRVLHRAFRRNWHWPSALTISILAAAVPLTAAILLLETFMRHSPG